MFSVHTTPDESPAILDFCLKTTRSRKSRDYRDVIVFQKLRFQNVFRPHENKKPAFSISSGLRSVLEKLCIRDGLVWTVGQPQKQSCVFKFLWFEERFRRKAPFWRRISVDGRLNRRNKPSLCLKIYLVQCGRYLSVSSSYFCPIRKIH